jgi:hypothetical protein
VLVDVTDNVQGATLDPTDCNGRRCERSRERHRRVRHDPDADRISGPRDAQRDRPGTAHVSAWTGSAVAAKTEVAFAKAGSRQVTLPLSASDAAPVLQRGSITVGWLTSGGATAALVARPAAP